MIMIKETESARLLISQRKLVDKHLSLSSGGERNVIAFNNDHGSCSPDPF